MPNSLDSFDFKENPYLSLLGGAPSASQGMGQPSMEQGMSQAMGQGMGAEMGGGMPQQAPQQPQQPAPQEGMAEESMEEEENQYVKGQNPDKGKPLMSAIQALEAYITSSEGRDEVLTARAIIGLLTKLMAKDQESMMSK